MVMGVRSKSLEKRQLQLWLLRRLISERKDTNIKLGESAISTTYEMTAISTSGKLFATCLFLGRKRVIYGGAEEEMLHKPVFW